LLGVSGLEPDITGACIGSTTKVHSLEILTFARRQRHVAPRFPLTSEPNGRQYATRDLRMITDA
jgi:hypothetical protein